MKNILFVENITVYVCYERNRDISPIDSNIHVE